MFSLYLCFDQRSTEEGVTPPPKIVRNMRTNSNLQSHIKKTVENMDGESLVKQKDQKKPNLNKICSSANKSLLEQF